MALRRSLAPLLAVLLLAAAADAQPGALPGAAPSPDMTQDGLGESPASASPDPAASPDPTASPAASPDPTAASPDTWQASPQPEASPSPSSPDPWVDAGVGASPTPSPTPTLSPSSPDPWATPSSPLAVGVAPTPSSPIPVPVAVPSPSPSPPPPPPPPPPPAGTLVNLALLIDGAASPLPADVAATIAQALSDLTPRFVWTFTAQQPALPEVPPKAPAEALPAPTAAPAAAPTAAAPGAVSINATAAPATAPLEQPRVTVDPLPLNQGVLGGRRRLRETNLLDLPRTEKGQCWSTKHPLVPDEPTCLAYCDALLAAGEVTADEMAPKFYDNDGNLCCRCGKKKEGAAGAPTAAPGAATSDDATPSTPVTATPAATTPAAPATPAADTPAAPAAANTSTTPAPATPVAEASAPAPPAAPLEPAFGVYYFASTRVMIRREEVNVNDTLRAALGNEVLLQNLRQTTGLSVKALYIMHLGSGPWAFAALPQRYERVAEDHGSGATVAASTTGPNKGLLLGVILGGVCAAMIALAVVVVVVSRRRRARKFDGQSTVQRWEAERQQADEYRRQQQEQRRQASQKALDKVHSKSGRSASSLSSSRSSAAAAAPARSPRLAGGLDRLRRGLGLGPRDHLAAAAARMEAAEAASAAPAATPVIAITAVQPATPAEAPAAAAQVAAAPTPDVIVSLLEASGAVVSQKAVAGPGAGVQVALDHTRTLKVTLNAELAGEEEFRPQQVFLRLTPPAGGAAAYFAAVKAKDGSLYATAKSADVAKQVGQQSGAFAAALLVGDLRASEPVQWELGSVEVLHAPQDDGSQPEAGPHRAVDALFQPLPEIRHMHRAPERRAPAAVSLLFTGVVAAPLAAFLLLALRAGANVKAFPTDGAGFLLAVAFHGGLAAICALYLLFWLRLNLMQTLPILAVLAALTAGFGSNLLARLAPAGAAAPRQKAE
ncbi:dolichyl-diphosphooligosaccharide-glycosyltransferase subunit 2 [Micractinium conductrix]|uniref:Ribophorin II n=1 Tax=Micractinium conductrix TaxID=554055 RepID=A0A2P6V5L6_9CHLO|nr:dolichyl-diphosphooligosaccharide-glycosyltransferase subunit 2 [Micractinium conductrix]|eukprot:PSC69378.1 dolichyl-diphosphooligosaccharide-glycosyltransferase subunit 2 [Micractinium conductrix]